MHSNDASMPASSDASGWNSSDRTSGAAKDNEEIDGSNVVSNVDNSIGADCDPVAEFSISRDSTAEDSTSDRLTADSSAPDYGEASGVKGGGADVIAASERKLDFIDDSMALALAEYGKKYGDGNKKMTIIASLFGGVFLGMLPWCFGINIWPLFIAVVGLSTIYATIIGFRVMEAYARHDYRTTSRLLSHALSWNALCAPFTYFTFYSCSQIQSRLLLLQGRYTEMESLLRISRAANERRAVFDGVPKHPVIANDLACTYIAQHRYEEAIELLQHVLNGKTNASIKQYASLNLALCFVKCGRVEESSQILQANEKRLAKSPEALRVRVMIVKSLIDLKSQRYEEAELKLEETIAKARKFKESDELLAICYLNLAELRWKQNRIDEADLYYRTGVDLFKMNCDPSYWSLAEGLRDYAKMLQATGQEAEAARRVREADLYESAYLEREMMRLTYLRYRVTHEKPVRMLTELVNVDGFPPLAIELNPPDREGFQKELDLDEVEIEARKLEALELEDGKKES
jgi:tetratricopeptide (TPR) repeat protein